MSELHGKGVFPKTDCQFFSAKNRQVHSIILHAWMSAEGELGRFSAEKSEATLLEFKTKLKRFLTEGPFLNLSTDKPGIGHNYIRACEYWGSVDDEVKRLVGRLITADNLFSRAEKIESRGNRLDAMSYAAALRHRNDVAILSYRWIKETTTPADIALTAWANDINRLMACPHDEFSLLLGEMLHSGPRLSQEISVPTVEAEEIFCDTPYKKSPKTPILSVSITKFQSALREAFATLSASTASNAVEKAKITLAKNIQGDDVLFKIHMPTLTESLSPQP